MYVCMFFEHSCKSLERLKRQPRKRKVYDFLVQGSTWKCDICDLVLLSKAGYVNHTKTQRGFEQYTLSWGLARLLLV